MKLISWNVNGLRACVKKGFFDFLKNCGADVVCLQETKLSPDQIDFDFGEYTPYWNSAEKKGYSGTAVLTKIPPLSVRYGLDLPEHDAEGRVITVEFPHFFLVNVYTPNSQRGLTRLSYRMEWEDAFRAYLNGLNQQKPVVVCGDMNVAHKEIDLKNPKTNRKNAGFTDEEREKMTALLDAGFVDSFRYFYPDLTGAYSWWSYLYHARENNAGWRIDYFLVSKGFEEKMEDAFILSDVLGSDHCPVGLILKSSPGVDEKKG